LLPESPDEVVWLGGGRDLAFESSKSVGVIHKGVWKSFPVEGLPQGLTYDPSTSRLFWIESPQPEQPNRIPGPSFRVRYNLPPFDRAITILDKTNEDSILDSQGRITLWETFAISPDCKRLAIVGLADASSPGLMQHAISLSERLDKTSRRARARNLTDVETQISLALQRKLKKHGGVALGSADLYDDSVIAGSGLRESQILS
jgi:hypothetical protein